MKGLDVSIDDIGSNEPLFASNSKGMIQSDVKELDGIQFWSGTEESSVNEVEKRRLSLSMIEKPTVAETTKGRNSNI